ncbi:MAG TPA: Hsp20/alpha crystallin family protein [Bacillales bacterium]|nr:Hsp20/alpha crystallin family protein [Bacillales bacterium]
MSSKDDKFPKFDKKALNDWMETLFRDPMQRLLESRSFRVDMIETDSHFIVEAELPGFNRDQIDIEILDSALKITASHNEVSEEANDNKHYYRKERSYGRIERVVPLPFRVNPKQTTANYEKGILQIAIPKGDQDRESRTIRID